MKWRIWKGPEHWHIGKTKPHSLGVYATWVEAWDDAWNLVQWSRTGKWLR